MLVGWLVGCYWHVEECSIECAVQRHLGFEASKRQVVVGGHGVVTQGSSPN